jgi:hypothetical protein
MDRTPAHAAAAVPTVRSNWGPLHFSTSASTAFAVSVAADFAENTAPTASMAWRFHSPTVVWWMPCFAASYAAVRSPRSASSATFALNSAEYRVRLPVIRVRPSRGRTELKYLPEFRGPAHLHHAQNHTSPRRFKRFMGPEPSNTIHYIK